MSHFNVKDLLRNRNTTVPLGPFDGRIAALHPTRPELYITTPYADAIPLPPAPRCNVYARFDGRYGHDDHTQWPQPFSQRFPHLACIPKSSTSSENSIMWESPEYHDFVKLGEDAIGMGKWSHEWIVGMEKGCEWLMERVAQRSADNKIFSTHPLLPTLSSDLERSLVRLRAVATTHRGAVVSLRLVQRLWLELHALMDYVHLYLPSIEGTAPALKPSRNMVGCFVHDPDSAQRLFAAGIPYWLIREVKTFRSENILSLDSVIQPGDVLVLDDYSGYAPRIYQGDSNGNRYLAIHRHSVRYLRYADPFAGGNPKGISPFEFDLAHSSTSNAGPSRNARHHSNAAQPYHKKSGGGSRGRDKFDVIRNQYMPPCLDVWRRALRNVEQDPKNRDSTNKSFDNNGRYAFPEPGIIASGENDERRNLYLTVWEVLQPVLIYRMSLDVGAIELLSNQQWRMLLGRREPDEKTRSGKLRVSVANLLTPDAAELGIDLSVIYKIPAREYTEQDARQLLWQLSELSFRFELLMLDRRAAGATAQKFENEREREKLMSPVAREADVLKCFPFDASEPRHLGFVTMEHAKKGIASGRIQDRLPYLHALRHVMHWWDGYAQEHLARLPFYPADAKEQDLEHYESAIAHFYTQTFYRFFGRAAIVPMYLS